MNRVGFIGGSDCVKIMQGDWLNLWHIKTGRSEPEDLKDNIAVQLGVWTEEFNLDWFEQQTDSTVINPQLTYEETIGSVPVRGTVDGMVTSLHIIEAKHTNAMNNMDNVIEYYMPQIQLYTRLAQAQGAFLSVIFGNNKWECSYVLRDEEYFDSMWAVVSDFWGYVVRDEEPVGVDAPKQISTDKIAVDNMVRRDAGQDNAFVDAAHTYLEHQSAARTFENAKKDLKAMVAANEREVYCDLLTVKRDKRGSLRITERK